MDTTVNRIWLALVLAFLALAAAAAPRARAATAAVSIVSFQFTPASVTIAAGDTVAWTNNASGLAHTATAESGLWDSDTMNPGITYSFRFLAVGTFPYRCKIHPAMTGTVVVQGEVASPTPTATPTPTSTSTPQATRTPAVTAAATLAGVSPTSPGATATRSAPRPPNTGAAAQGGDGLGLAWLLSGAAGMAAGLAACLAISRRRR